MQTGFKLHQVRSPELLVGSLSTSDGSIDASLPMILMVSTKLKNVATRSRMTAKLDRKDTAA